MNPSSSVSQSRLYDRHSREPDASIEYVDAKVFNKSFYFTAADGTITLVDGGLRRIENPSNDPDLPYYLQPRHPRLALMKYCVESGLRFVRPTYSVIAFDIETYDTATEGVPLVTSRTAHIGMICATYRRAATEEHRAFVLGRRQSHPTIPTEVFAFEPDMCTAFIQWVRSKAQSDEVLLVGFNSSCGSRGLPFGDKRSRELSMMGYDLPFIIHRSGMSHQEETYFEKRTGAFGISHSSLFGLHVHCVDIQKWLANDYAGDFTADPPENESLNAYLEGCGLGLKLNEGLTHAEMHRLMAEPCLTAKEDVALYQKMVEYCDYDASSLLLLMDKRAFFEKTAADFDVHLIPFSDILFTTPAARLLYFQARDYYTHRLPFDYTKKERTGEKQYRGGYNLKHDAGFHSTNTTMGDFESSYPNNIRAFSISPFTFVGTFSKESLVGWSPEQDEDADLTDPELSYTVLRNGSDDPEEDVVIRDPGFPEYFVFRKGTQKHPNHFSNLVGRLFEMRRDAKKKMAAAASKDDAAFWNVRQNTLKRMINTMFGLTGNESNCFWYRKEVGAAITLGGRIWLNAAMHALRPYGPPTFADTDSVSTDLSGKISAGEIPDPSTVSGMIDFFIHMSNAFTNINENIREYVQRTTTIGDASVINFQFESHYQSVYYPKEMKSYIKMEYTLPAFTPDGVAYQKKLRSSMSETDLEADTDCKFKPKGFQFRERRHTVRTATLEFVERLIRQGHFTQTTEREMLVREFYERESKRMATNLEQYARKVKLGGKGPLPTSIKDRFPLISEDAIWCVPLVSPGRGGGSSKQWTPIGHLPTGSTVDTKMAFSFNYASNLCRFFPELKTIAKLGATFKGVWLDPTSINIRVDPERIVEAMAPEDVESSMLDPQRHSYHEIIVADAHRAYFDLDSHTIINIAMFTSLVSRMTGWQNPAVLEANGPDKFSYHVIYPVVVQRAFNEQLALHLHGSFDCVDTGVYTKNHSIRLPNCVKVDKSGVVKRMFKIPSTHRFLDCLITNVAGLREETSLVYTSSEIDKYWTQGKIGDLPEEVAQHFSTIGEYVVNKTNAAHVLRVSPKQPYDCPVCQRRHEHDSLHVSRYGGRFIIDCYRNVKKEHDTIVVETEVRTGKAKRDDTTSFSAMAASLSIPEGKEERYVSFDLSSRLTFIRSALGTGKTHQLKEIIEQMPATTRIVYVSSRRTFTSHMCGQFESFKDYRSVTGSISLVDSPRVIVQVDSLERVNVEGIPQVDLLVLDEIESILNQLTNYSSSNGKIFGKSNLNYSNSNLLAVFNEVIVRSAKIVVMDGCLSSHTQNLLRTITGEDKPALVENWYKPFSYETDVRQISTKSPQECGRMASDIESRLEDGKKVVSMCTSKKLCEALYSRINGRWKVALFTGEDLLVRDGRSMLALKKEAFADINAWIVKEKPDLLMYTTTLTAGVSIDVEWFDEYVHFYNTTISPIDFIQGTSRVRSVKGGRGALYIGLDNSVLAPTDAGEVIGKSGIFGHCLNGRFDMPLVMQLDAWLCARKGDLQRHAWQYVLQYLTMQGWRWTFHQRDEPMFVPITELPLHSVSAAEVVGVELTEDQVAVLSKGGRKEIETTDASLLLAKVKYSIMRAFALSVSEVNDLTEIELGCCMSKAKTGKLQRLIKAHRDQWSRMPFGDKRGLMAEDGDSSVWEKVDLDAMLAEQRRIAEEILRTQRDAEILHTTVASNESALTYIRRAAIVEHTKRVIGWVQDHEDASYDKTEYLAARREKRRCTGITGEFSALMGSIPVTVYRDATNNKNATPERSDPWKLLELLASFSGINVSTTSEKRQVKKERHQMVSIVLPEHLRTGRKTVKAKTAATAVKAVKVAETNIPADVTQDQLAMIAEVTAEMS